MSLTYYITGIAGFVGVNLINELDKEKDIKVIGFVLPSEKDFSFLKKDYITLVEGNILNEDDVEKFLSLRGEGEKIIIHLAGRITTLKRGDPLTSQINVEGTKNIVDVANKIGDFSKFIYISSVDALPKHRNEEDIFEVDRYDESKVDGVYSKSKAIASNFVLDNFKNNSVIVLPSAIMGPNDVRCAPINNAIKRFLNDKLPAITKGGYNIVDVRDVAKGILLASKLGKDKQSYLLTGEYVSVKYLIKQTALVSNKKPVTTTVPHFAIKLASPSICLHSKIHHKTPLFTGFSMDCLKQNSRYNYKKAATELGYKARPIEETISDTVKWMKESGYLDK